MKTGFDAKRITHNSTGLGNYGRLVVEGLSKNYPANDYCLYTINRGKEHLYSRLAEYQNVSFCYPKGINGRMFPSWWRSHNTNQLQNDGIDIYHGLSNELPFGINRSNIASVVTIHDLIFLRYPQFYSRIDRKIYEYKFRRACFEADLIIATSKQTKDDIVRFFKINECKIEVIYQCCNESYYLYQEELIDEVRNLYKIDFPYILYTGSIESRKNLLTLVKAFEKIKINDIKLIAVGRRTPYLKQVETFIKEHKLSDRVKILTDVPNLYMPSLYQMSKLFVYPSFFEGFGIPVLEALASNVPVIAATGSCLEETGGSACVYVNPENERELAYMMEQVLTTPALSAKMTEEGQRHLQNFSPKLLSQQLISLYERII